MAEKTKLKWLRKEFSSSEELEYYLTQLKHQDKLKSDIISLLQRFQHLLFASYEPDYLTISYNGQWDVNFSPASGEEAPNKKIKVAAESRVEKRPVTKATAKAASAKRSSHQAKPLKVDLKTLLDAQLLTVGTRLKHKSQPTVIATVTRDGHLKIGKNEYQSLSGAATSFVASGRRDGWLTWLFQDKDGAWKPIDLLRDRWRESRGQNT